MTKEITKWQSNRGNLFDTKEEAEADDMLAEAEIKLMEDDYYFGEGLTGVDDVKSLKEFLTRNANWLIPIMGWSTESQDQKVKDLKEKLGKVYSAGVDGIGHVAMANYESREQDAIKFLDKVMYGE
jgi:hypothetical protein